MQKFRSAKDYVFFLLFGCSFNNNIWAQKISSKPLAPAFTDCDYQYSCRTIETPAHFPGGVIAWRQYLLDNTMYPETIQQVKTEDCVRILFVISKYGNMTDVQALDNPASVLSVETIRVIKASPLWRPAYRNGRPISYRFIQTFVFRREADNKLKPSACDDPVDNIRPFL